MSISFFVTPVLRQTCTRRVGCATLIPAETSKPRGGDYDKGSKVLGGISGLGVCRELGLGDGDQRLLRRRQDRRLGPREQSGTPVGRVFAKRDLWPWPIRRPDWQLVPKASYTVAVQARTPGHTTAAVRSHNGVPTLLINGQPYNGMVYAAYDPSPPVLRDFTGWE